MTSRFAGDVVATVRDSPFDAILADGLPGILIGAHSTGLPTAALLAQTYLRPTPGLPLLGTGWSPLVASRVARGTGSPRAATWLLNRTLSRLNAVTTRYGQSPLDDVFALFDRCRRVLVLTSPSFNFQHLGCQRTSATSGPSCRTRTGRPPRTGTDPAPTRWSWSPPARSTNTRPTCFSGPPAPSAGCPSRPS